MAVYKHVMAIFKHIVAIFKHLRASSLESTEPRLFAEALDEAFPSVDLWALCRGLSGREGTERERALCWRIAL